MTRMVVWTTAGNDSGSSAVTPLALENGDPSSESEVTTTQPEQTPDEDDSQQFQLNQLEDSQEAPPGPNMELEFPGETTSASAAPSTGVPSSGATGGSSMPAGPSSSDAALMPPPQPVDPALLERKRVLTEKMQELRLGKLNNPTPRTITCLIFNRNFPVENQQTNILKQIEDLFSNSGVGLWTFTIET